MAVLEKLRKRPKLLMGLIGGALLLFILTAINDPGALFRFNDLLTLQIGDERIEYNEYQEAVNLQQKKLQEQNPNQKTDAADVQQQVVQQLIGERIIAQECKDASLDVTDDEIYNAVKNDREVVMLCAQNGMTPDQVIESLKKNPNADGGAVDFFNQKIKDYNTNLKNAKLGLAVMGCLKPNNLDAAMIGEDNTQYDIEYAKVDYAQYANDPKYKVTDNEIKEAYEQFKEFFKIDQDQRRISYIKVDLDPSANDIKVANSKIAQIYNDFATQEGIKGIKNNKDTHLFIDSLVTNSKSNTLTANATGTTEPKDPIYTELLEGGVNSMKQRDPSNPRDRNTFIYKVTKVVECPDSIGMNYVQVYGNKHMQDSVFALLSNGVSIDSLQKTNKNQNIAFQKFDPSKTPSVDALIYQDSIRAKIMAHLDGSFFLLDSQTQGDQSVAVFTQVVQHKAPVKIYSIARAKYENDPSETTVNILKKNLQAYIDKNKNAADFKKNAKAAKYDVKECVVDAYTTKLDMQPNPFTGQMMGGLAGSRDMVKWAFENKPGTVSEIKEDDEHGYMLVVAVEEAYEGYTPYTDPTVKQQLTTYIQNKKIGEALVKQCGKANDIAEYAQKLNTTVDSIAYVPGSQNVINDRKVAGRIIGMGKNAVGKVQVIAGENALYVVKVNKQNDPRPLPKEEIARNFFNKMGVDGYGILWNSRKISNSTLKFVN